MKKSPPITESSPATMHVIFIYHITSLTLSSSIKLVLTQATATYVEFVTVVSSLSISLYFSVYKYLTKLASTLQTISTKK